MRFPKNIPQKAKGKRRSKNRFSILRSLGEDRMDLINAMFIQGNTLMEVVERIQMEWGQLTDMKPINLKMMLSRYRKEEIIHKVVAPETIEKKRKHEVEVRAKMAKIEKDFDGVSTMINLVDIQKDRLNKILLRERERSSLLDTASREVQILASLVTQTTRLQMDLGVLRPVDGIRGSTNQQLANTYEKSVQLSAQLKQMTCNVLGALEGDFEKVVG